jgi:AcrR family transcriptional regulator
MYAVSRDPSRPRSRRGRGRRSQPQSIWTRPEPAARKPAHTRDRIAQAAIKVADAEGFAALTMRRVAAELGAGTMTLYHYVRTKDELLALVDNALIGEVVIPPDELPEGWRAGMREIARRTRNVFVDHPWASEMPQNVDDGPNGARHFEQSLAVMSRTGLPEVECLELVFLVDDYVFGYIERYNPIHRSLSGDPDLFADLFTPEVSARLSELDAEAFPNLHSLFGEDPRDRFLELLTMVLDESRFDRGLDTLLDGIERRVTVGDPGFEPGASALSERRSNRLS